MSCRLAVPVLAGLAVLAACQAPGADDDSLPPEGGETPDADRPRIASPAEPEDGDPDPSVLDVALVADEFDYEVAGELVSGFAYNGQVPGPTLRASVGETLRVRFRNDLEFETTIHWHGLSVPYAMDGVAWQSAPIPPGGEFFYEFELLQAGTFWYHPHFDTVSQVDKGLFGALVVEDPAEPLADVDAVLVVDAWDESGDGTGGAAHMGGGEARGDDGDADDDDSAAHEGAGHSPDGSGIPRLWLVNGQADPILPVPAGSVVRARIVNASNESYAWLNWPEIRQIGSDQGLLPALASPDALLLAPGDRADVELLVGSGGIDVFALPYSLHGGPAIGDPRRILTVEPLDEEEGEPPPAPPGLDWPFAPAVPTPDPGWTDVLWAFSGDPMTGDWLINGAAFPDVAIEELLLGDEAIVELRNLSPTEHPFHLHGMPFEVLSVDGVAPSFLTMEDTVNVRLYESLRLRLLAENPGDWMAHCHILAHAEGGMMTVLRVSEGD
jgi:FtsP/CotA-like multicopper oxidase with cupredoxin domain